MSFAPQSGFRELLDSLWGRDARWWRRAWPRWVCPVFLSLPKVGFVGVAGELGHVLEVALGDAANKPAGSVLAPTLCGLGADPMQAWRAERALHRGSFLLLCQGDPFQVQVAARTLNRHGLA